MATGTGSGTTFTAEERAAMKERAKELKLAQSKEADVASVLEKIEGFSETDLAVAAAVHEIATKDVGLDARLWYGSPAYYKGGKLICFFQDSGKFTTRYSTLGFSDNAQLDDGAMWPSSYAVVKLTASDKARIAELIRRAAG